MKVDFYKHNISDGDIERAAAVLRGPMLTTGKDVKEFEEAFAAYLGATHAVGVTSCTAALHISLLAAGVGPGDEVIVPAMTFMATSNAVLYTGAMPVFTDVNPETALMEPEFVEKAITPKTKAIIPVHLYGQMCDMEAIRRIADKHGLTVIEDCAHAIESSRDGIRPGQLGDAACFSFYATKNLTSGEGGTVATNSRQMADALRLLRSHGMTASAADRYNSLYRHWDMETLGWKYNMANIQAALLIGQMPRLEKLLERREEIARRYEKAFTSLGIQFPVILPGAKSARHLFTIWVDPDRRDAALTGLQREGIGVAVNYRAVHLLKYYRDRFGFSRGAFPEAEHIGDSTLTIPLYPKLTDEEVEYVIKSVAKTVAGEK